MCHLCFFIHLILHFLLIIQMIHPKCGILIKKCSIYIHVTFILIYSLGYPWALPSTTPQDQYVAVCCIVLQCVLQCVAVWCSVVQCVTVWCSVLQCVKVCYSVLQCFAVCCSRISISSSGTQRDDQLPSPWVPSPITP